MVTRALLHHGRDQVLWNTTKAEATDEKGVTRLDILDSLLCTRENLLAKASES